LILFIHSIQRRKRRRGINIENSLSFIGRGRDSKAIKEMEEKSQKDIIV
jgi:hypothetical protein